MNLKRATLSIDADTSWLKDFKAKHGTKHLLAMSRGKDAIASWLVLRDLGFEVVPFHLYIVPDLEFVQESINDLEKFFGVKILQRPHRSLWRMLDDMVYQPPYRIGSINELNPRVPSYQEIYQDIRNSTNSQNTFVASGVRACDSIMRRLSFQTHGHIRINQETFFPVWNFRKSDVLSIIAKNGLRLPVEYSWFSKNGKPENGRSFDGIDRRFLAPIKEHSPDDYQRILEWFPLAEIEMWRHEIRN